LGIVSIGLALINTIAMNITLLSTPKQFGGVMVVIVQVFTFTGMAMGPVISGVYIQNFQTTTPPSKLTWIPSNESYALIFLTSAIASLISVMMAFILKKTTPPDIAKA
jgi:MFS family permease